jgi:hypothetical protein
MEDGKYLSKEDQQKLRALIIELANLKTEHKNFAKNKGKLSEEDREKWRANSTRTNQVHIEIKDLRLKNILEAGK